MAKNNSKSKLKNKSKIQTNLFLLSILAYPVLHFILFSGVLNINTLIMSFQRVDMFGNYKWFGFNNYKDIFDEIGKFGVKGSILSSVLDSLLFFPLNNFVLLPISIFTGYILYRKIALTKFFRIIFFLPSIISIVVLTMVFKFMFDSQFGPITEFFRIIGISVPKSGYFGNHSSSIIMVAIYCIWSGIGYNVVLVQGAMLRVPEEVIESGRLDGISMTRELWQIIVPIIFPTINTMFLIGSTAVFTLFLQPQLLTGSISGKSMVTIAMIIINWSKSGLNSQIQAATFGILVSVIGTPLVLGIKYALDRITPEVDY